MRRSCRRLALAIGPIVAATVAGARDQDHRRHKPAGVYRIAVLGDSFSEAMQVGREQAFWRCCQSGCTPAASSPENASRC